MSEAYRQSGVDISAGDAASTLAAKAAKKTFSSREGKIGAPVSLPGGFAGILDFGEYYLVQCCDTVGTKIDLAEKTGDLSGLGADLLAMVADDAVCLGAEVVSITNTFETQAIETKKIEVMMESLAGACKAQEIVIAGGEIAEVGKKMSGTSWGADAVGIVEKQNVITGEGIEPGDTIITLREKGFRCNGFSLVRKILREKAPEDLTLARACLRKSTVYHAAILDICGRYGKVAQSEIKGIAHITGGGIPGNITRILRRSDLGAKLTNLFEPGEEMQRLIELCDISQKELYEVWNMGNGMMIVCDPPQAEKIIKILEKNHIEAQIAGEVTDTKNIGIQTQGGEVLSYEK